MLAIYNTLKDKKQQGLKSLAVLIDPDKVDKKQLMQLIQLSYRHRPDFWLVGGSLMATGQLTAAVALLKQHSDIPVVLFPGSYMHLSGQADAILFLSLISGRNPEYLIGNHVTAAPTLRQMQLEVIPTGYMLINCGNQSSVSYISNTVPLPYDKPDIAVCTAIAGEMLGLRLLYLEGGSGAQKTVSPEMVRAVSTAVSLPVIAGGGIRSAPSLQALLEAGADLAVVGTIIEQQPALMEEFCAVIAAANQKTGK